MHTAACLYRVHASWRHDNRIRVLGRVVLAAALTAAITASCGGRQSPSANESSRVRGATYRLSAVDGAALPTRFAPLETPQVPAVQLDSGRITFHADGRAGGAWHGTNEAAGVAEVFQATYVQIGSRVLIYRRGDDIAPDTAEVSDQTITVRAQFFRPTSNERYVVVMTYAR
jgi:hypothetical protein